MFTPQNVQSTLDHFSILYIKCLNDTLTDIQMLMLISTSSINNRLTINRGVFPTLPSIYDGVVFENRNSTTAKKNEVFH